MEDQVLITEDQYHNIIIGLLTAFYLFTSKSRPTAIIGILLSIAIGVYITSKVLPVGELP